MMMMIMLMMKMLRMIIVIMILVLQQPELMTETLKNPETVLTFYMLYILIIMLLDFTIQ